MKLGNAVPIKEGTDLYATLERRTRPDAAAGAAGDMPGDLRRVKIVRKRGHGRIKPQAER
jgi:hypothetical protein